MSVKGRSCFRAALDMKLLSADSWIFMGFIFTLRLCHFSVYRPISMVFLLWMLCSPREEG